MSNLFECPRIDDAAGYVLRALPDADAESYRDHLTQCVECAEKVAELGFVSHAMLSAVPQLSAPPEIRDRVMAVVRAEAELLQAAGAGADRLPRREPRRFGLTWIGLRPLAAGAVASVLLAVGLGVGILTQGGSDAAPCTSRPATVDQSAAPGGKATLKVCEGSSRLELASFTPPPSGRIYEVWRVDPKAPGAPKEAGLFSVHNGKGTVDVRGLKPGELVLVTHEAAPAGSDVPTSMTPIVKVAS